MNTHSRSIVNAPLLLALVASLLGGALTFTPAHAIPGQIHVNTATDVTPADDGVCTLREAIIAANANTASGSTVGECAAGTGTSTDDIRFDADYTITLDALLGTLNPSSDMYLWGRGTTATIIQASTCDPTPSVPGCTIAAFPVLTVTGGTVSFDSLTVQHGATGGGGGGIYNNGGSTSVNFGLITRNYAASGGGGVYNQAGSFSLYHSTADHNKVFGGGGGGGLYNQATMFVWGSTVSYNAVVGALGGGLTNSGGTVSVANSTFYANYALQVGGLYNTATADVLNSTFSNNDDTSGSYGGIANDTAGSLNLRNSLLANNTPTADCTNFGTLTGDVNNLIESNSGCGTPSVTSDPGLLTFAPNGGFWTNTLAIDGSSSAFAAGDLTTCNSSPVDGYDQRGFFRRVLTCDIGAFEYHAVPANDEIATATVISSLPYSDSIDTIGATTGISPADPIISCQLSQKFQSVWYEYTPASSGLLAVNTWGSNYDTVLEVWQGSPGITSVGCNGDTGNEFGYQSSVVFPVTASTTYTIEVTSHGGFAGSLLLNVFTRPIPTAGVTDGSWFFLRNANSAGAADLTFQYGWAGPTALVGDWDGNATTSVGIDDASWFFLSGDSNSPGPADNVFQYGWAGATPIMGDWDGNGTQTVGIYDGGTFFLRNSNSAGAVDNTFSYGWAGATPLVGDWDGNGTTTVGIYDSSTGTFFLREANSTGAADYTFGFGPAGAKPVVGDWNGDGLTTIGVFSGGNFYLRNTNAPGPADITFPYAWSTATPVMGDWDGL